MIDNINVALFDEKGGNFCAAKHGITVTVPSGAVPSGKVAEMKFAATTIAPVKFSDDAMPVSAIVWLCMNVTLQKPIQLQMPHYVNVRTEDHSRTLQFAKANGHLNDNNAIMEVIKGGTFPIGESYGIIEIDHFCYYCIQKSVRVDDIPKNLYQIVTMKEMQPNIAANLWNIHICIIPSLATCFEVYYYVANMNYIMNLCKILLFSSNIHTCTYLYVMYGCNVSKDKLCT